MDRKSEIIAAVMELASEKGLGAVSMQQIADRVGITKASLYNHYTSKDEIVEAMYHTLRESSKSKMGMGAFDANCLTENRTMRQILSETAASYRAMCMDPEMLTFYRIIMSERAINKTAAEIMVTETATMINATKMLFYALQIKGKAHFPNADAAAFSFAMAVHSIIDYECDLNQSGKGNGADMLADYIDEFCRIYSA
ncbi:MAG: TetR/AcrR family transcriptional regulator [Oscillospiraceae bacterium]|nr:TetR/AcrR family transcriptional regulator [Oscillospiraceae bacterium]